LALFRVTAQEQAVAVGLRRTVLELLVVLRVGFGLWKRVKVAMGFKLAFTSDTCNKREAGFEAGFNFKPKAASIFSLFKSQCVHSQVISRLKDGET
jgi:hypothetical protein